MYTFRSDDSCASQCKLDENEATEMGEGPAHNYIDISSEKVETPTLYGLNSCLIYEHSD